MPSAQLRMGVSHRAFAALPHFGGPRGILARVAEQDSFASNTGFPLWTPGEDKSRVSQPSQSPWRNADAAREIIAARNPDLAPPPLDARYVIAGQQAGLLTGPLYTFWKGVSLVLLARRMAELEKEESPTNCGSRANTPGPILPLFWIASEDHDVLEVNRVVVNGRKFTFPYEGGMSRGPTPQVADISRHGAREPLLAFLREALQPTEFTPWILDMASAANFSNYMTLFEDLMRALFGEWRLRLIDPIALRTLMSPVLAAAIERWPDVVEAMQRGTDALRAHGFEPPLSGPGIFEIDPQTRGRRALEFDGGRVRLSAGTLSLAEAAEEIRRRPADFSPNAALRPVVQDAALPVVATLGGPAELLYLWQINPLYEVLGVRRSRILPRISVTLVESHIQSAAEKLGLWPDRIFDAPRLLEEQSSATSSGSAILLEGAAREVEEKSKELLDALNRLIAGKGIGGSGGLQKSRERLAGQIEKVISGLREEALEREGLGRRRLEKIASALMPENRPQERVANIFTFLNLYGPDFIRRCMESLDPLAPGHQIAALFMAREET